MILGCEEHFPAEDLWHVSCCNFIVVSISINICTFMSIWNPPPHTLLCRRDLAAALCLVLDRSLLDIVMFTPCSLSVNSVLQYLHLFHLNFPAMCVHLVLLSCYQSIIFCLNFNVYFRIIVVVVVIFVISPSKPDLPQARCILPPILPTSRPCPPAFVFSVFANHVDVEMFVHHFSLYHFTAPRSSYIY